jgi:hypothetical protein
MPHYKNGKVAKVGDYVKGYGYNVKNEDGTPKEIVGQLIEVKEGEKTCNVVVAYVEVIQMPNMRTADFRYMKVHDGIGVYKGYALRGAMDYGQADHFEKVE